MIKSEFRGILFGKTIEIIIYDIPENICKDLFEEIYVEALRLEKIFNFYDPKSELSQLNKKRKLIVSDELLEVIKKGILYSKLTNGEYDITLGKQILERKNSLELSKIKGSYKNIKIKNNEISLENKDILIDLGSIAKGFITDKLVLFMKDLGIESGLINARGDIRVFGEYEEKIAIQHPRDKEKFASQVLLKDSSIATTGDYNQFYGNYDKSHILNKKDLISVSVIADNLTDADVFASAVFLLDKNERKKLIRENPEFKIYTIDKNLKETFYNNFEELKV